MSSARRRPGGRPRLVRGPVSSARGESCERLARSPRHRRHRARRASRRGAGCGRRRRGPRAPASSRRRRAPARGASRAAPGARRGAGPAPRPSSSGRCTRPGRRRDRGTARAPRSRGATRSPGVWRGPREGHAIRPGAHGALAPVARERPHDRDEGLLRIPSTSASPRAIRRSGASPVTHLTTATWQAVLTGDLDAPRPGGARRRHGPADGLHDGGHRRPPFPVASMQCDVRRADARFTKSCVGVLSTPECRRARRHPARPSHL